MKKLAGFLIVIVALAFIFKFSSQAGAGAKITNSDNNINVNNIISEVPAQHSEASSESAKPAKLSTDKIESMSKPIKVIKQPESKWVGIKQKPNSSSKTIGKVYGNLTEINVLGFKNGYAFIEAKDYSSGKDVRGYVPKSMIGTRVPKGPYCVVVDLSEQLVYVYKDGILEKEMICSTGEKNSETPTGKYFIGLRGKSFYSKKYGQGGYNWVRFNYNYLFHSVPFDSKGKIIPEEELKLGTTASHGCVRLPVDDSKWFYNTIPSGTMLIIQE